MDGFYVTNLGTKKIAFATNKGEKVSIDKFAVGDGGLHDNLPDYDISTLNHETYRKTFDDFDLYEIDPDNESMINLTVVIPNESGNITVNEVGFFDSEDELIVYGVVDEASKGEGRNGSIQTIELLCHISFVNTGIDNIEIVVGSDGLMRLNREVNALEERVEQSEQGIVDINEALKGYVQKEEGKGLSSNDFTRKYLNQINENKTNIESNTKLINLKVDNEDFNNLAQRVTSLEKELEGLAKVLEETI